MSTVPEFMPILSAGAHKSAKSGACVMEYASFLNGEEWSDAPACTHPALASMARNVNDKLGDDERQALLPLLPRLMGTTTPGTFSDHEAHVLSVRLAVWCAQQVQHLNDDDRVRVAIETALAWCEDKATQEECASAYAYASASAYASAYAAYAAYAAAYAAYAASAYAAASAASAYAAASAASAYAKGSLDLVALLTGLIDEFDRLTGRTNTPDVTQDDLRRMAELTRV